MGLDIIDIALDTITDDREFERLASELMREEGYPTIEPLGGTGDSGRDAVEDRFFEHKGRMRTVFQYTLQDYLPGKIRDTVAALERNGIEVHKLVIVTSRCLSSERIDKLKATARSEHSLDLDVFPRERIRNRLANYANGVFHRHFPNIDQQVLDLKRATSALPAESGSELERALLRSCLCLCLAPGAERTRRSIFDNLVCGVLAARYPADGDLDELLCSEPFRTLRSEREQISASLQRLASRQVAQHAKGRYRLSPQAAATIGGQSSATEAATDSLVSDVLQRVSDLNGSRLSQETERVADRNIRVTMLALFRLYGMDIAAQYDKLGTIAVSADPSGELVGAIQKHLDPRTASALSNTFADVLASPTDEQATVIARWCRAYLGLRVMNADPTAVEFQRTRLKAKLFVLDTDFLLDCVIAELPSSASDLALVKELLASGCRVIVPFSAIAEAVLHAEIALHSYELFGVAGLGLNAAYIREAIRNAFVKGYFLGVKAGAVRQCTTFETYRANYYDAADSEGFFRDVIRARLPVGVEVLDPAQLLSAPVEDGPHDRLCGEFLTDMTGSAKAETRRKEESQQLARNDASLFLTVLGLNPDKSATGGRILRGSAYIVTRSSRYRRVARRVGLPSDFVVHPASLAAVLDLLMGLALSPQEVVGAMSNPFMVAAVEASWPDVRALVQSGVETQDKSVARLRRDLDESLHSRIAELHSEGEAQLPDGATGFGGLRGLISAARGRGYRIAKEVEDVMQAVAQESKALASAENEELKRRLADVEAKFGEFGKRKQRYLRRVAAGLNRKP